MFGADYKDGGLIFCRPDGGLYSPDRVGTRVVELMKKSGLEGVSLHSLRQTHAKELISKSVPIAAAAKRLGHANASITLSIYTHALESDETRRSHDLRRSNGGCYRRLQTGTEADASKY